MNPEDLKTRQKILTVAFSQFLAKGYDNTPIQGIIDAVGIAKGTFYHHFASKDAMLVSLVNEMTEQVLAHIRPLAESTELGVMDKIVAISRAAASQKASQMGPEVLVIARQMRSAANRPLADCLAQILQQKILPLFTPIIQQGVDTGLFHVRHPEWATQLLLSTIMGFQDPILEAVIAVAESPDLASAEVHLLRLTQLYETLEEALERQLGAARGSFPLYSSIDFRSLWAAILPGGPA